MGQYWIAVNLDKREYINPHTLSLGAKLCEIAGSQGGIAAAIVVLMAAQREVRGGGDLDMAENWHGPERQIGPGAPHNLSPGPMPEDYPAIAMQVIGRWAGDRVALVGDYAEDSDLPPKWRAGTLYKRCCSPVGGEFTDISAQVARVLVHEFGEV